MIKQVIQYADFDDEIQTEIHYFHLSKSELIDMEQSVDGGLAAKLVRVSKSANGAEIMTIFKELIAAAYGQRVDGSGSKFYKSPELSKEFMESLAFDAFLTTLLTDPKAASAFINGILPKDMIALTAQTPAATDEQALKAIPDPNGLDDESGAWPRTKQLATNHGFSEETLENVRMNSGLNEPYDVEGYPLPWVFCEPTHEEFARMNSEQMMDVYRRKASGWQPPAKMIIPS